MGGSGGGDKGLLWEADFHIMKKIIITEKGKDLGWDEDLLKGINSLGNEFLLTRGYQGYSTLSCIFTGIMLLTGESPYWFPLNWVKEKGKDSHYAYSFGYTTDPIFTYIEKFDRRDEVIGVRFIEGGPDGHTLRGILEGVTYPANKEIKDNCKEEIYTPLDNN